MKECYQIKTSKELINYLSEQGRRASHDFDYQLQTNFGVVHELISGEVVFFPNNFQHSAILFKDKKCFDEVISSERFPVDNPQKSIFEIEEERIKTFHLQSTYYRIHLNKTFKFDFQEITRDTAQAYLSKVIGRSTKKLTTPTDIVALISVIGELVKKETNGRWFLEKSYGMYNPIYKPNLITSTGNIFLISSRISGCLKWKTSNLENVLVEVNSTSIRPTQWDKYSQNGNNLLILE